MASLIPASQLDKIFGCLFLTTFITSVLWGIGCLQLYIYYEKYWKTDKLWLKIYVLLPWILDTAQQVIIMEVTCKMFVRGIGNPLVLLRLPDSAVHLALLSILTTILVQCLYIQRAWHVSNRSYIVTTLSCISVMPQLVSKLVYYGTIYKFRQITDLLNVYQLALVINCMSAFSDTALSVIVIWLLLRAQSGVKRTDSMIRRIVMYIISSGLATAVCAIVALICVTTVPDSSAYLLADLTLPKLYFNCMLAALNARSNLHVIADNSEQGGMFQLEGSSFASTSIPDVSAASLTKQSHGLEAIECRVDIDIESEIDQRK